MCCTRVRNYRRSEFIRIAKSHALKFYHAFKRSISGRLPLSFQPLFNYHCREAYSIKVLGRGATSSSRNPGSFRVRQSEADCSGTRQEWARSVRTFIWVRLWCIHLYPYLRELGSHARETHTSATEIPECVHNSTMGRFAGKKYARQRALNMRPQCACTYSTGTIITPRWGYRKLVFDLTKRTLEWWKIITRFLSVVELCSVFSWWTRSFLPSCFGPNHI